MDGVQIASGSRRRKNNAEHDAKSKTLKDAFLAKLKYEMTNKTKAGDLDGVLKIKDQIAAVESGVWRYNPWRRAVELPKMQSLSQKSWHVRRLLFRPSQQVIVTSISTGKNQVKEKLLKRCPLEAEPIKSSGGEQKSYLYLKISPECLVPIPKQK